MKKILLFFYSTFSILFYAQNYKVDNNFNKGVGANNSITNMCLQSDGKIIVTGIFTSYDGITKNRIARLNSDGSIDSSFDAGAGLNLDSTDIITLMQLKNGKILIAGSFINFAGSNRNYIARLNSDGSLDNTFNKSGSGTNYTIYSVAEQADGKILIAGDFSYYNGVPRGRIARLNTNGSLDNSFDSSIGSNNNLNYVSLQSDGKVLLGGYISSYNNTPRLTVARLTSNGSLDLTFNPIGSGGNMPVSRIVSQNDNKIIVSGSFSSFNNVSAGGFFRLNEDGSTDQSFQLGIGRVAFSNFLPDNKILTSTRMDTTSSDGKLYVLKSDGSIDDILGPSGKTIVETESSILVSGNFTSYNGIDKKYIVRLKKSELTVPVSENENKKLEIYPNPAKDILNIKANRTISGYEIYSMDGKKILFDEGSNKNKINISKLIKGNYILKLKTDLGFETAKFSKE